jgi:hypothetical protein
MEDETQSLHENPVDLSHIVSFVGVPYAGDAFADYVKRRKEELEAYPGPGSDEYNKLADELAMAKKERNALLKEKEQLLRERSTAQKTNKESN